MPEKVTSNIDSLPDSPPINEGNSLNKPGPNWKNIAFVATLGGMGWALMEVGENLNDLARATARADVVACLNQLEDELTEEDLVRCEEYGLSRLSRQ